MELGQVASRSFVLLRSDWSAERALRMLGRGAASHVVIHRQDDPQREYWYVFRLDEVLDKLTSAPRETTLRAALGLAEPMAVPVLDARSPAEAAPERSVVAEDGMLVAFVDQRVSAGAPPQPVVRGARRGPRAMPEVAEREQQRSLEAEFPDTVAAGSVEWLLVHIAAGAASARGLALHLAAGEQLDILVQPRKGFTVEGTDRGTLVVPAEGDSMPLQFKLHAVDPGQGLIRVVAFSKGEPLGVIELAPMVGAESRPVVRGRTESASRARKTKPLAPSSPQVPDLAMFIEQRDAGGNVEYLIRLTATDPALDLNLMPFGPFRLNLDPAKFFADFFQEIEELPLDTDAQRELAERRLAAKGSYLSDAVFPQPLREKLWEVRERIGSIIVQSEEPWIPWEICKLSGKDGDRIVEGPFLSEKYAITRWLPGVGFKRPLSLRNIALVVPPDSGLPLANKERDQVLSLAGAGRKVTSIPATFADLQDAFTAGSYDGWHFTGHGAARDADPDRSSIILGGEERFTPQDLSGQAINVGIPRPLVFINACQVGRSGMALTGIGGWARRFLGAGAAAFIGAYWSVYDEPACGFAKEVYAALLAGKPVGEAVRVARSKVRTRGDPTWLAYTVFADPLATVA